MSKLLDFLNPHRTNAKQARTVERIAAIGHSCDAVGWRPVPYEMPQRFEHFLSTLESDIDGLIAGAHPDLYNARFYEETVEREVQIALMELRSQRTDHLRSIHNIRIYQNASLEDINARIHQLTESLNDKKEEKHDEE